MKVVRDRGDARWLPSRFHFALFRLIAYACLKTAKVESSPGIAMSIERNQSAIENFTVAICILIVAGAFIAMMLLPMVTLPVAILIAIPASAVLVQVIHVSTGALLWNIRQTAGNIAINSFVLMTSTIAAATLLALSDSPVRHVGIAFLLLVAANALASVVVFVMHRPIAEAERRFGVDS